MSPLGDHDLKNLRFYAAQFKDHQWQSPWIHWSVFHQTLNEIADRVGELDKRFKEESAMRDRYKRQSDGWRDKALQLAIEARCPVCVNGQMLSGGVCQECHGKDCASVAYDTLRMHYKRVVEACKAALKLPRPWMDGGLTYTEWDIAFGIVEDALAWKLPDKHVPPANPHASDCNSWVGEPCNCITGKEATDWREDWEGQPEL